MFQNMRRAVAPLVVAATLVLAGCAGTGLGTVVTAVTATIENPISGTNIAQVKTAYAGALELQVRWRRLCWSRPYAALLADPLARPLCENRRPVLRAIQAADGKAYLAVQRADAFVKRNPTLSAAGVLAEALAAISDLRRAIPAT